MSAELTLKVVAPENETRETADNNNEKLSNNDQPLIEDIEIIDRFYLFHSKQEL